MYTYLLIINLLAVILMLLDKGKAKKGMYRISEKTLFTVAVLGGGIGVLLGMNLFHHKTKKRIFKFGIPTIILAQFFLVYCFKYYG